MTGYVDLFVLRRIADGGCRSMSAIIADCSEIPSVDRRVRELEIAGLVTITLKPTKA